MAFTTELKSQFTQMLKRNKIVYKIGWSNFMRTVNNPAAVVIDVANEHQLSLVIKEVKKLNSTFTPDNKITMKATAGWSDTNITNCCCFFPWHKVQEEEYNESFSFSQVVGGKDTSQANSVGTDVIIRFKKEFHKARVLGPIDSSLTVVNPKTSIHQLPSYLVEVSAGMQIAEFADFLRKNNLSLTTVSMISWVTIAGLTGTAGHGTGRDEPAFSGLIESFTICDQDGIIRELKAGDPDFEVLRGGHSGLLGVVVSMKIRVVKAFNLKETIDLFIDAKEMKGKLDSILKNNQYVSFLGMPSPSNLEVSKYIHKWQIRKWNHTTEAPTESLKPTYAPAVKSLLQQIAIQLGNEAMGFLVDPELKHLLPDFMLLAAVQAIGLRGTKPIVNYENNITHPQVGFPPELRDVDYFIPVKDAEAGEKLEAILQRIEELLSEAAKKEEYPVTYAIYVRYIKGTNGGLSTSSTTSADERILAIDIVTHPNASGIARFEQKFMMFLKDMGLSVRNHLGKDFPVGIERYDQFLDSKDIDAFIKALERWHATPGNNDGEQRLAMSPFYTPYFQKMLNLKPMPESENKNISVLASSQVKVKHKGEYIAFLTHLCHLLEHFEATSEEEKSAKMIFLQDCQNELKSRLLPEEEQHEVSTMVV